METHLKSCQYKLIKFKLCGENKKTSFVKCEQCTECSSVKLQRDNEPCLVSPCFTRLMIKISMIIVMLAAI